MFIIFSYQVKPMTNANLNLATVYYMWYFPRYLTIKVILQRVCYKVHEFQKC